MAFNFKWNKKRVAPMPVIKKERLADYPMPKMPKGQDMEKMRSNLRRNISSGRGVGY